ncbi:putative nuclease domain protein, partial [Coccomyxa subellipsoidea C-169]
VFRGPARVVDGDTLEIAGERVRLLGIDAPEKGQMCQDAQGSGYECGVVVKDALTRQIGSSPIECQAESRDMYGRNVSKCDAPGTGDLGTWLVSNGYAVAYRQYSKEYVALEESAEAAHRGIWAGSFQEPAEWRREHKRKNAAGHNRTSEGSSFTSGNFFSCRADTDQSSKCAIKGNISSYGKIYHVPGSNAYESVRINVSSGERWFCSREEAEQAGWRAS